MNYYITSLNEYSNKSGDFEADLLYELQQTSAVMNTIPWSDPLFFEYMHTALRIHGETYQPIPLLKTGIELLKVSIRPMYQKFSSLFTVNKMPLIYQNNNHTLSTLHTYLIPFLDLNNAKTCHEILLRKGLKSFMKYLEYRGKAIHFVVVDLEERS